MIENAVHPLGRIHHPELLDELLGWVAAECGLGTVAGHRVSEVGYDDCNVVLRTERGAFLVKVFTKLRAPAQSARYVTVIERAIAAGVRHPRLFAADTGVLLRHPASGNLLVVMEFVTGATFLDLDTFPTPDELALIVDQLHCLHGVDLVPEFVHDWWAIPNIGGLAREVTPLIEEEDRAHVLAAARRFAELDPTALPHALVHGDLTKANVMRAAGSITVLDFAVANHYPRIHELAMITVNLMHGDPRPIPERIEVLSDLYGLSAEERAALPPYVFAAAAMELLGAAREWHLKGNRSTETHYLLELGRTTVRAAAC